jgi:type II secretory pathway pseudopilin PulG
MTDLPVRQHRRTLFLVFTVVCVLFATGYVLWSIARDREEAAQAVSQAASVQNTDIDLATLQQDPYLLAVDLSSPQTMDQLKVADLGAPTTRAALASLKCFRVYYAGGTGICLQKDPESESALNVILFDENFQPKATFPTEGYPTRARVSPDGRYAAYTVFVTGHSYNELGMSTATVILDVQQGKEIGNLEEFTIWHEGRVIDPIDQNFWGVTFARDSQRFYATLQFDMVNYLVEGDLQARTVTVIHRGVECPSLSPDETRLAFKKQMPGGRWRLAVLDLATFQETLLAETENVDDQVEWLDDQTILYGRVDPDPPPWLSIMRVPADGSGQPEVFLPGASSPAVVWLADAQARLSRP